MLHVVFIPLGFLVLLWLARTSIRNNTASELKEALAFVHAPFKRESFAWEYVETSKKLLLVGFARVLVQPGSLSQLLYAILVALGGLVVLTLRRPYASEMQNGFAIVLNFCLVLFLLLCLALKVCELTKSIGDLLLDEYHGIYSFDLHGAEVALSTSVLSGLVLFAMLSYLNARRAETPEP